MPFANRTDAGRKLAAALEQFEDQPAIVLALPRGGVPVAREVAAALGAPLDLVLVRKIGVPMQPELAMGAVVDGPQPITVRNEDVIALSRGVRGGVQPRARPRDRRDRAAADALSSAARPHRSRRAGRHRHRRRHRHRGDRARRAQGGKRAEARKLVLAVPVAPTSTLAELRDEVDEIVCLEDHEDFGAIGFFYADFSQVSDQEVKDILAEFPAETGPAAARPGG